jgi:death-on-curing protein
LPAPVLSKAGRLDLADCALHAPAASLGDEEFYAGLYDKAAVLTCRLAWNHPLPDGNKRAAGASLLLFIDLNGGHWSPDPPDVDQAEVAMLAVAAGEVDEAWFAGWLRDRSRSLEARSSKASEALRLRWSTTGGHEAWSSSKPDAEPLVTGICRHAVIGCDLWAREWC